MLCDAFDRERQRDLALSGADDEWKRHKQKQSGIFFISFAVAASLFLAISTGKYPIDIPTLVHLIASRFGWAGGDALSAQPALVLRSVRLPRILMAVMTGAALSVAGVLLQGIFKNPLVSPTIMGVTKKKSAMRCYRFTPVSILLLLAAVISWGSSLQAASKDRVATRVITDMVGRKVEIPAYSKKIACLDGPAYEKIFAFGAANRVVLVPDVTPSWGYTLNPDLKNIPSLSNFTSPDVEQLLKLGTDLVIFKPFDKPIRSLTAAGIPVVVAYEGSRRQKTMEDFIQDCYAQIRFYGLILGGDAPEITERYCAYVDGKIRKVLSVTGDIPAAQRPRVFYYSGMASGPAGTQSKYTTTWWLVEAAGGTMMTYTDDEARRILNRLPPRSG